MRPGESVHFLMYYTVKSIRRNVQRTYRYQLVHAGQVVYSYSGKNTQKAASGAHRFVYYTDYAFPRSAAFGVYTMRITLTLDGRRGTREWSFVLSGRPKEGPL